VNLTQQTFQELSEVAQRKGCSLEEAAEEAVRALKRERDGEWALRLEAISEKPLDAPLTEQEGDLLADLTVSEVRSELWARKLAPAERKRHFQAALAELRSGIPASIPDEELDAEAAQAVREARAERRARGH
jgi:hypothetical protein